MESTFLKEKIKLMTITFHLLFYIFFVKMVAYVISKCSFLTHILLLGLLLKYDLLLLIIARK